MRKEITICDICKNQCVKGCINLDCYRVNKKGHYCYSLCAREICTDCADEIMTFMENLMSTEENL